MEEKLSWWAYVHTNGNIQVKRFFDKQSFVEADESGFVVERTGRFFAKDRDEAVAKANKLLLKKKK